MSSVLDELLVNNDPIALSHTLAELSGFKEKVPTIEDFIDDEHYMGRVFGDGLYPIWRKEAIELFPTPYTTTHDELILTSGIGTGKTTFALLVMLYDICKLLSLENPHDYYDLLETTIIAYSLVNATKDLVYAVVYDQMTEMIEMSPYFRSKLAPGSRTLFVNNIDIVAGSRGKDYLGMATVGALFSEINDMTVVKGQAEDSYDTVYTRRGSRFGDKGLPIFGHIILDSSSKGTKSFIDVRLEEKKKANQTDFKLIAYAHWSAKFYLGKYSGYYFRVFAGTETQDPFILDTRPTDLPQHPNIIYDLLTTTQPIVPHPDFLCDLDNKVIAALPPNRILTVPIELYNEFNFNIIKSIRDLAGASTFGERAYLTNAEMIAKCFIRPNPVKSALVHLDFFDKKQQLIDYIPIKQLAKMTNAPRYVHLDLSLKWDTTGIACSYMDGYVEIVKYNPLTGTQFKIREPRFVTEWVVGIQCIPGQEIPLYKIKEFLIESRKRGYPIVKVTTDGYQSANIRQDLLLVGFDTELLSTDRTKDPYDYYRNVILEDRLQSCSHSVLMTELRELIEFDDKYDHPDTGSKDILDAACGSIWSIRQAIDKAGTLNSPKDISKILEKMLVGERSADERLRGHLGL